MTHLPRESSRSSSVDGFSALPNPEASRWSAGWWLVGAFTLALLLVAGKAWSFPPLTPHVHYAGNIQWELDGTENGDTAHNHRSNQDLGGFNDFTEPWSAFHCWDNRTDRLVTAGAFDEGHCFVDEPNADNRVRYRFLGAWNAMARQRVVDAFDAYNGVVSDVATLVTGLEFVEVAAGGNAEIDVFWDNQGGANGGGFWNFVDRELHLDNSMNWYFAADPMEGQAGGIQNGQWHFFSVALHEVGHAVGFFHQSDLDLMDPTVGEPPENPNHRYFMGPDADTIDGIRDLYSQPSRYWTHQGDNGGGGSIFWWRIAASDFYVSGDFNGDGTDELLALNPNGWHHTMSFDGSSWSFLEGDDSGQIAWWIIGSADSFVVGDFNGDGRDELLALNPNGWHHTMSFNGSSWNFLEGDGSGQIAWWVIGSGDSYLAGDFDGDGRDELLALNPNGWHHTMRFNGSSWSFAEGDSSGQVAWWVIGSGDSYEVGDFTGGSEEELLAVNPNGWHHTMRFNGSSWSFIEGDGSGAIHWWLISGNDDYTTGDFDCDGREELLAVNPGNGWSQLLEMQGNTWPQWQTIAGNDGSGQMGFWLFGANDFRLSGAFNGGGCDLILNINPNGWWQVNSFP